MVGSQLLVRWLAPSIYPAWESETGPLELGTVLVLLPAVAFGLGSLRWRARLPQRWLAAWFALCGLGCLYLAGEELSWGQHLFGWQTPEWLQSLNDQNETNLHNISGWFDQQPRTLLELWILASVMVAAARLQRGIRPDASRPGHWFWPWPAVLPAGVLAIAIRLPERISSWTDWTRPAPLDVRLSESQEFCFALFLLIYLWEVRVRLKRRTTTVTAARPG